MFRDERVSIVGSLRVHHRN